MGTTVTDMNVSKALTNVDPGTSALVVIDMQNDFCAKGGYFDRTGADLSAIEPVADRLVAFVVAARRAGAMVVFVRSHYDPLYLSETQKQRRRRVGWDMPLCRDGTWGAEFYRVAPLPDEPVVTKHRFDAFYNTDLELILSTNGRRTLLFAGVSTNVCVESSLRSAFMRDFEVVLLSDCAAARNQQAHQSALENVRFHFGTVATAGDIELAWNEFGKERKTQQGRR